MNENPLTKCGGPVTVDFNPKKLPPNKTKLVCTIGPASNSPEVMLEMIRAGMNVARINYSHGDFAGYKIVMENLRQAALTAGKRLTIMADLPGPKMRVGKLAEESIQLKPGETFTLTTDNIIGDGQRVSVSFPDLPKVVKPGNLLFLNDGIIQLEVLQVTGNDIHCRVFVGGELRSRKGLNLPGINLGISAFTEHDYNCLKSALENGADVISQSFVETAADIEAVRKAAKELGYSPFIIAKIERSGALTHIDEILNAADGIMIARGDLGVEIPIERIAVVQKQLTHKANLLGKPVITATQMLESMVEHCRPTRAEATDVANAILDGTDCVMLSEESAMGRFPVEAVQMLAKIAAATEPYRTASPLKIERPEGGVQLVDLISRNVRFTVDHLNAAAVLVPSGTGLTARMISRFKLPVWILAVGRRNSACQGLQLSYGVFPILNQEHPSEWKTFAQQWVKDYGLPEGLVVLTEGPSQKDPHSNHRLEIIDLTKKG